MTRKVRAGSWTFAIAILEQPAIGRGLTVCAHNREALHGELIAGYLADDLDAQTVDALQRRRAD